MARISFECSKCGMLNNASSFFAKKVMKCEFCGAENNIKDKKVVTRYCAFCDECFSFEQSLKNKICPSCGHDIEANVLKIYCISCERIHLFEEAAQPKICPTCGCDLGIIENMLQNIIFGRYPQDINYHIQPIEWEILDRCGGELILISKYDLDCIEYTSRERFDEYMGHVYWYTCTLRSWLRYDFVRKAFNSQEQAMLLTTFHKKDPVYGVRDTEDEVFLLSIDEAQKYAKAGLDLKLKATNYANSANGHNYREEYINAGIKSYLRSSGYTDLFSEEEIGIKWWLRSPGTQHLYATVITEEGDVSGYEYPDNSWAIRPVIKINLKDYLLYKGYRKNNK